MKKSVAVPLLLLATLTVIHARGVPSNWNLYDLLLPVPLVVVAEVNMEYSIKIPGSRVFRLESVSILSSGVALSTNLYLFSGSPTTGSNSPPNLSNGSYLLFLVPISEVAWGQASFNHSLLLLDRSFVYEIVGNWQGAVSQNHGHTDRSNEAIRRQYGITDPETILESVRQILAFLENDTTSTNTNALTDAFLQQFNFTPFRNVRPIDPTRFRIREYTPQAVRSNDLWRP